MKRYCLIAALVLVTAGCSSPTAPDTVVSLVRLQTEAFSGFTEPDRLVIRDDVAWHDAWTTLWQFTTLAPSLPDVDFSRDMVVIVAMGSQSSSGYTITIESAVERGDALEIAVLATSPGHGCAALTVITNPVDVVRLPRHSTVTFVERKQTRDCT
jgi:hypothetical protein